MTLEVPAGFAAVEGLYCMVCSDKIYYPVVINKNSKAFAINTMNEMFELLFDAENGAPVHIARNNEKYFGYRVIDGAKLYATAKSKLKSKTFDVNKYFHGSLVENEDFKFAIPDGFKQLKNYMVSVNADRVFYPVLIETNTGKPYAFDVKNQMYPVLVDTSGVPVVMGPDGTIFPGMIENAGNPIFSSTSSDETYVSKTFPTPSKR
uniref:GLPGLI family protein n=1 Tax=Rhabditophanes sp. KR3021 TaxID=114890 RepID=A0AC35UGQ1_9BILA